MAAWFRANKMAVNVSKMKYIIFKPRGKRIDLDKGEGVVFNNNYLNANQIDPKKIFELDRIYDDNPNVNDRSFKLLGVLLKVLMPIVSMFATNLQRQIL
jgi:hypothetical protein